MSPESGNFGAPAGVLADYLDAVAADDPDFAFTQWLGSLTALTGSADAARQWRERRYAFAYRLGEELAGQSSTNPAVTGSAVYGIWLRWGLLYVGQTTEASRRLRDLPVGESHHLANTFPPEIWDRVVVIDWPHGGTHLGHVNRA